MGWQICPMCSGQGEISGFNGLGEMLPPETCQVCRGKRIISESTGLPPRTEKDKNKVTYRKGIK